MKEFLIENGFTLFGLGLIPFVIIFISLFFYLGECGNLSSLMLQITKHNMITEKELGSIPDIGDLNLDIGFGKLPSISKTPHYFEFKTFRDQLNTIKYFRKIYKVVLWGYGSLFVSLFIAKRIFFLYY